MKIKTFLKRNYFTKIEKCSTTKERIDKLNIFEYIKLIKPRQSARKEDMLLKEIINYFDSSLYYNEFNTILSTDLQKFKFFLLHISLLSNRFSYAYKEASNKLDYKEKMILKKTNYNLNSVIIAKYSEEIVKHYIKMNFHLNYNSPSTLLIEQELYDILVKEQINHKAIKTSFLNIMNKINNLNRDESIEESNRNELIEIEKNSFNEKILNGYLLINRENQVYLYHEKFYIYCTAHFNYLNTLSIKEILENKIYWGLKDDLLLNTSNDKEVYSNKYVDNNNLEINTK